MNQTNPSGGFGLGSGGAGGNSGGPGGGGYEGGDAADVLNTGGNEPTTGGEGGASFVAGGFEDFERTDGLTGAVLQNTATDGEVWIDFAPARVEVPQATWLHLAIARAGGTYGDVLGPFFTQGFPGADVPATPEFCNAYTYDPQRLIDGTDAGGDGLTFGDGYACVTDHDAPAPVGSSVWVYVFADQDLDGAGDLPHAVDVPGPAIPYTGTFDYADRLLHGTHADLPIDDRGFDDLGNVFDGTLRWGAVVAGAGVSGVAATAYVYDPGFNGGAFRAWTGTGGGGGVGTLPDGGIPRGQGFFVQTTGPSPSLPVAASAVLMDSPPLPRPFAGTAAAPRRPSLGEGPIADVLRRHATPPPEADDVPAVFVQASVGGADLGAPAYVWFHAAAALGADPFDAAMLAPLAAPTVSVYTVAGEASLSGNALPTAALTPGGSLAIPLAVEPLGLDAGTEVTLTFTGLDTLPGVDLRLVDRETGDELDLTDGATYRFTIPDGAARTAPPVPGRGPVAQRLAATGDPRFELALTARAVDVADDLAGGFGLLSVGPNPTAGAARVRYRLADPGPSRLAVVDVLGRVVAEWEGGRRAGPHALDLDLSSLAPGPYVVRLRAGADQAVGRVLVVR